MRKLILVVLIAMIGIFVVSNSYAKEYWCVERFETLKLPLPFGINLGNAQAVVQATNNDDGLLYTIKKNPYLVEVYIEDNDGELEVIDATSRKLILKAGKVEGVAHNVTLLVKDLNRGYEMPLALTTPIGIEVRKDRANCNN